MYMLPGMVDTDGDLREEEEVELEFLSRDLDLAEALAYSCCWLPPELCGLRLEPDEGATGLKAELWEDSPCVKLG